MTDISIGKNDNIDIIVAMKLHLLVCDGVFDLGLAALTDTVGLANAMAGSLPQAPAHIELTLVGVRRRIRTAQGLTVPVVTAHGVPEPDVVLVPAFGDKMPDTLSARLTRPDVPDAVAALQHWSTAGAHLGAACSGSFLLAESGLLDGHRATTSWWLGPMFRQRYPNVMALRIIRGRSPALAALVARYLLVETRSSQAEFVIPDHLAHADPMVERYECWARSQLAKGFSLAEAASAAGTSERTLARRLQSVLGKTPLSYFQDLRVEHAVHLLRTGNASVDQVAAQVGYSDGVTLRALLRRKLGRGVRELRRGG